MRPRSRMIKKGSYSAEIMYLFEMVCEVKQSGYEHRKLQEEQGQRHMGGSSIAGGINDRSCYHRSIFLVVIEMYIEVSGRSNYCY